MSHLAVTGTFTESDTGVEKFFHIYFYSQADAIIKMPQAQFAIPSTGVYTVIVQKVGTSSVLTGRKDIDYTYAIQPKLFYKFIRETLNLGTPVKMGVSPKGFWNGQIVEPYMDVPEGATNSITSDEFEQGDKIMILENPGGHKYYYKRAPLLIWWGTIATPKIPETNETLFTAQFALANLVKSKSKSKSPSSVGSNISRMSRTSKNGNYNSNSNASHHRNNSNSKSKSKNTKKTAKQARELKKLK